MKNINLKVKAKQRILEDVIQNTLRDQHVKGGILILDLQTSTMISQYTKMEEVITSGIVFVENIERKRKSYPQFAGLYIIQPTKQNFEFIEQDFSLKKQYKTLNIFFLDTLTDNMFNFLQGLKCKNRIKILKELNLNFNIVSPTNFICNDQNLLASKSDAIQSAASTLENIKSIQVCSLNDPKFLKTQALSKLTYNKMQELHPYINSNSSKGGKNLKIFLFERNFDLVTPLIFDLFYENILKGILQLDFNNIKIKGKEYKIDYDDEIFQKYAYEFIQDASNGIKKDFDSFMQTNAIVKSKKRKNQEQKISDLQGMLGNVDSYNKTMAQMGCHISLCNTIMSQLESQQWKKIIDDMYTIITAITEHGEKISSDKRKKLIEQEIEKWKSGGQYNFGLIYAMLYIGVFGNSASNEYILTSQDQSIINSYKKLIGQYGVLWSLDQKEEIKKLVKKKYDNNPTSLHRYITKMEYIIEQTIQNNNKLMDVKDIGQINKQQKAKSLFPNSFFKGNLQGKQNSKDIIMIYVDGGVSGIEARSIKNLQVNGQGYEVMVAGDNFIWPNEFIKYIQNCN